MRDGQGRGAPQPIAESAAVAVAGDGERLEADGAEQLDPGPGVGAHAAVRGEAEAELERVPARAGVEVEPPARGGGCVAEPLRRTGTPERSVEVAVHTLRRLRAGPVLHPRVEPPGAPPVEDDAREAQPLVRRALHPHERPRRGVFGERRRIGDDEPHPPAARAHEPGRGLGVRAPRKMCDACAGEDFARIGGVDGPHPHGGASPAPLETYASAAFRSASSHARRHGPCRA